MLELMAYADGELEGADRARVEARIAAEPDVARFVDQVRGLGGLVRDGHAARCDAAGVDGIADAVLARLANEKAEPNPAPENARKVLSLDRQRSQRPGLARPLGVATLVALAAGVVLWMQHTDEQRKTSAQRPLPLVTSEPVASLEVPSPATPKLDDPDDIDSTHQVSVFYLPSTAAAKAPSVVVWIGDDDNGAPPR
jgi:anti-sigma factor RsiW